MTDDIERSLLDRVAQLLATEAIHDAVGDVLTMLQSRIIELETRLRAETTEWTDGTWWLDLVPESDEISYFYEPTGPEWMLCVSRERARRWSWELTWNPPESHSGRSDTAAGHAETAYDAMCAAEQAFAQRPMPTGPDPTCSICYGWGYWCGHGGGPPHDCEEKRTTCACSEGDSSEP